MNSVDSCRVLQLGSHREGRRGALTAVEGKRDVPFPIRRAYYIYDVPGGESRGAHAHRELQQLVVAASGSFTMTIDDGTATRDFTLSKPYEGLYIPPGLWRDLRNFSSGAVALVLTSAPYDEADYIRDYNDFLTFRNG